MDDQARTVCVTGMHRSGTSLTASWLGQCGLTLDDGEVYGAAEGNPRGHFEDKQFVDVQAAQILRGARRSRTWIYTSRKPFTVDEQFDREARQLIDSRNAKYSQWGWKDPRTVLFLEPWRALIPGLKALLLWRPCEPIVTSLVARSKARDQDGMKIGSLRAVRTWLSYNERALAYKNDHTEDTLLLPLRSLLADDRRAFSRIRDHLGLELEYKPLAHVYEPSLLHKRSPGWFQRGAGAYYRTKTLEAALSQASDRI